MTTQFGTYLLFTLHTLHTQLILTCLLCNNQHNRKQQQDPCLTNATQSFQSRNTKLFKRPEFSLTPSASVNDSSACAGPEAVGSARFSPA